MVSKQKSWFNNARNVADFLWKLPKTQHGWLKLAGSTLSDYAINRQRARWETLTEGFENMDSRYLGKGAGKLIASWMEHQREASVQDHLNRLEAIIMALDEHSLTPLERAFTRFTASKTALYLEGYTSKLSEPRARYQRYQKEAKAFLKAIPMKNYSGLSEKDIFLGEPFHPESLFLAAHRFLDASSVEQDETELAKFLTSWQNKAPNGSEDFYAQLLALTHRQNDAVALTEVFSAWFDAYRTFMLSRVERNERWINRGMDVIEGRWIPNLPPLPIPFLKR